MKKEWWIKDIRGESGPFSLMELRNKITPRTWVKKTEDKIWKRAREVPELQFLFQDEKDLFDLLPKKKEKESLPDNEVLTLDREDPPFFYFWLLVMILVVGYMLSQFLLFP